MPGRIGISLESLHYLFWEQRDPDTDTITVVQKELAEALCVSRPRAGQVLTGMMQAGRITKIEGARSDYVVADPAGFVAGSNRS